MDTGAWALDIVSEGLSGCSYGPWQPAQDAGARALKGSLLAQVVPGRQRRPGLVPESPDRGREARVGRRRERVGRACQSPGGGPLWALSLTGLASFPGQNLPGGNAGRGGGGGQSLLRARSLQRTGLGGESFFWVVCSPKCRTKRAPGPAQCPIAPQVSLSGTETAPWGQGGTGTGVSGFTAGLEFGVTPTE